MAQIPDPPAREMRRLTLLLGKQSNDDEAWQKVTDQALATRRKLEEHDAALRALKKKPRVSQVRRDFEVASQGTLSTDLLYDESARTRRARRPQLDPDQLQKEEAALKDLQDKELQHLERREEQRKAHDAERRARLELKHLRQDGVAARKEQRTAEATRDEAGAADDAAARDEAGAADDAAARDEAGADADDAGKHSEKAPSSSSSSSSGSDSDLPPGSGR